MDIEQLNKTPHEQICDLAKDKFIEIYNQKFGEGGEVFFEEQKALFNNELLNGSFKGYLAKTPSLCIHDAFMNLAINGLSLEKGSSTLCYLMGYSNYDKNTGGYNYTAKITYTGYGEILLRQRAGQIVRCDNPVVVYSCDEFRFGERDGHKFVEYIKQNPRQAGSYIVACYVKIILPGGGYDYFVMDREGIDRLKTYSEKFCGKNGPNALYGGVYTGNDGKEYFRDIDTGFLVSKTCKHAFKNYPKLKVGIGAQLQADIDTNQSAQEQKQEIFGSQQQQKQGVKINASDDDPF
jgi:hypothetical protein